MVIKLADQLAGLAWDRVIFFLLSIFNSRLLSSSRHNIPSTLAFGGFGFGLAWSRSVLFCSLAASWPAAKQLAGFLSP